MNYVPVTAGTISNDSARTSEEVSQDCIVMLIWKDTSYFDLPTKDVENGEPITANDAQKHVEDGPNNENAEQERFADDSSTKDVNAVGQHVNTANPDVNTGSLKLNVVGPSVNIASSNEQDSTEDEPEVDLGNIMNSYIVQTTPNTRIHKDHPIDNVIGEVKSTVQTRRMTKPTSEQGFLSDVEAMQEELLQFKLQQVWILVDLPKFAKTHNVVAFLEKPEESDGFAEVIDFLKASSVSYALTVNRVIYTSYIEQFWATAKVQTVSGVRQIQALVDKKRVIVMESSIRRDLHLDDAEGTNCVPTATIFEELTRMG
ncbi:hypothetical protein Tco_0021218, partial [Tanacetum coccineum]